MKKILQHYGTLLALFVLILLFGLLKPRAFLSFQNLINITRQMSPLVVIAAGATLVMAVNEFDLSVGSMASLGGVIVAILAVEGWPIPLCFAVSVLICLLLGLANGFIVGRFRVLSFITTLGMGTILDGITYRVSGGTTVFQGIPKSFSLFGTAKLFGTIPVLTVFMFAAAFVLTYVMKHTTAGRKIYAIGGNEEAARISGISVLRFKMLAFALCGTLAGTTGIMVASRVGSANTTAGSGYFLQSYAAAFIGCTLSRENIPNIPGTLAGAAILAVLANGLTILQMPSFMQDIITGAIIIAAIILQKAGQGDAR